MATGAVAGAIATQAEAYLVAAGFAKRVLGTPPLLRYAITKVSDVQHVLAGWQARIQGVKLRGFAHVHGSGGQAEVDDGLRQ
jgi:hypothetical protein